MVSNWPYSSLVPQTRRKMKVIKSFIILDQLEGKNVGTSEYCKVPVAVVLNSKLMIVYVAVCKAASVGFPFPHQMCRVLAGHTCH